MPAEDIKKIKMSEKDIRSFGRWVGGILVILAGLSFWHGRSYWFCLAVAGAPLIVLAQIAPMKLKSVYRGWMILALGVGWVMTRVILTVIFFGMITPLALLARLARRRFLQMGFRENRPSYWIRRSRAKFGRQQLETQF